MQISRPSESPHSISGSYSVYTRSLRRVIETIQSGEGPEDGSRRSVGWIKIDFYRGGLPQIRFSAMVCTLAQGSPCDWPWCHATEGFIILCFQIACLSMYLLLVLSLPPSPEGNWHLVQRGRQILKKRPCVILSLYET